MSDKINTLDEAARKKLMSRVQKLMAMAASNSPAEAEIALSRAQRLMAEYGLTQFDVDASAIETERAKTANKAKKATAWDGHLASSVAKAFSCRLLRATEQMGNRVQTSEWEFVGIGPSAKVAAYAYSAMRTQLVNARKKFIDTQLFAMEKSDVTRLADSFAAGWAIAATRTIREFAGTPEQAKTLDTWIDHCDEVTGKAKTIDRSKGRPTKNDSIAIAHGYAAGKDAKLHHGVDGGQQQLLIGGAK